MRRIAAAIAIFLLLTAVSPAQDREPAGGRGGRDPGAPRGNRPAATMPAEVVALEDLSVVLGRPTADSITLNVLSSKSREGRIEYGTASGVYDLKTDGVKLPADRPAEVLLDKLAPDRRYFYRLAHRPAGEAVWTFGQEASFHTQRAPGGAFVFTVQADSHLDENASPELYCGTLANALADHPDFHVDMGDTFMTDKHAGRESAARQYLAQRYYLGLIGQSAPIFLVLGNHDGEDGKLRSGADSLTVWSNSMRKRYFPNPLPDDFYTGNAHRDEQAGLLQDYYAWQWGDALFVVLDPYWYSPARRGDDCWGLTLGRDQYDWLKATLQASKARFKFVFIHQLVGGVGAQGRGGVEAAAFGEWGGKNADGTDGFKEHRPGWDLPIHDLLVATKVTAVFHGHDHLFAKQDLGGIVYQEVPQPGFAGRGPPHAAEYGYASGTILPGSGHLRVTVTPAKVTVDYVRSLLAGQEAAEKANRDIEHTYTMP